MMGIAEKQHWQEMGAPHPANTVRRWEAAELLAQWDTLVGRCKAAEGALHGEACIACMYADALAILDAERRLRDSS